MEFQELKEEEDIRTLINRIEGQGEMAFDFHLDDYKYPVSARVDSFLIALNEREIYSLPFTENCLQLFNAVFSNAGIKKYILHGKESFIVLKKNKMELRGFVFDPLWPLILNPSDKLPSLEEQLEKELNLLLPEE